MLAKLLLTPGLIWLLLPPICVCHLPGKLLGAYQDPPADQQVAQNAGHAPGCPAARIHTPSTSDGDDCPDQPLVADILADVPPVICLASGLPADDAPCPADDLSNQDLYLILCALRN